MDRSPDPRDCGDVREHTACYKTVLCSISIRGGLPILAWPFHFRSATVRSHGQHMRLSAGAFERVRPSRWLGTGLVANRVSASARSRKVLGYVPTW